MAKAGLDYEVVATVAHRLASEGFEPTNRLVLAEVGGSATTVHRHLRTWWEKNPKGAVAPPELPGGLQKAIQDELRRQYAQGKAEVEGNLTKALQETEDLARAAERFEGECDTLREQLAAMKAERDRSAGQREQQAAVFAQLQQQLQGERVAGEAARIELAQIRIKVAADTELLAAARADRDRLIGELEQSRRQHIDVERSLAAATAAMAKMQERVDDLQGRNGALEKERNSLQATLEAERTRSGKAERELASSEANLASSRERVQDLERREAELRRQLEGKVGKAQPNSDKRGGKE